jgi:hypothetical protein
MFTINDGTTAAATLVYNILRAIDTYYCFRGDRTELHADHRRLGSTELVLKRAY